MFSKNPDHHVFLPGRGAVGRGRQTIYGRNELNELSMRYDLTSLTLCLAPWTFLPAHRSAKKIFLSVCQALAVKLQSCANWKLS